MEIIYFIIIIVVVIAMITLIERTLDLKSKNRILEQRLEVSEELLNKYTNRANREAQIAKMIRAYILTLPKLDGGYTYSREVTSNKVKVTVHQKLGKNAGEQYATKVLTIK